MPSNSVVLVRKTGNRKWNVSQSLHHVDGEPLKVPPFYVYPHMRRDICSSLKALVPKRLGGKRKGCTLSQMHTHDNPLPLGAATDACQLLCFTLPPYIIHYLVVDLSILAQPCNVSSFLHVQASADFCTSSSHGHKPIRTSVLLFSSHAMRNVPVFFFSSVRNDSHKATKSHILLLSYRTTCNIYSYQITESKYFAMDG